jgi:hypothetical protein
MAVGDIYRIDTFFNLAGQDEAMSRRHYRVMAESGDLTAEIVADEFVGTVLSTFADCMHENYIISRVVTTNLMDFNDFNETNPEIAGELSDNPMPTFIALGFRSPMVPSGHNRGRTNLPFGTSANTTSSGRISGGLYTEAQDVAQVLGLALEASEGELHPYTVRYTYVSGSFNAAVPLEDVRGVWQISGKFTSQVTRKGELEWLSGNPS